MGADLFENEVEKYRNQDKGIPNVGIGEFCEIDGAIIDKNARIGNYVKLVNKNKIKEGEKNGIYIREGIIIVPKGAVVPDNFTF
jgi:glucose-1-phosphate adenylyltransferase